MLLKSVLALPGLNPFHNIGQLAPMNTDGGFLEFRAGTGRSAMQDLQHPGFFRRIRDPLIYGVECSTHRVHANLVVDATLQVFEPVSPDGLA